MTFDEALADAERSLAGGDANGALNTLRTKMRYPGELSESQWAEAIGLFSRIAKVFAGDDWANNAAQVAEKLSDPQALYDLGFELNEHSLHDMAAGVLARVNRLLPGQEVIVTELVVALEGAGQNAQAVEVLRASPDLLRDSPWCDYLLGFNALMTRDLETPRGALRRIEEVDEPTIRSVAGSLRQMLARADAMRAVTGLGERDLRGWHFVMTGGVLLHLSPYGSEDGMNGRYAFVQDTPGRCLEGIRRVEAVLESWNRRPARVLVLSDPDSAALGLATARVLGVPAEAWTVPRASAARAGLVVAYDLGRVGEAVLKGLAEHRLGQALWVHTAPWTEEPAFAGDFTTYLHQMNRSPWDERLRLGGPRIPAAQTTPEERAGQIVTAEMEPGSLDDLESLLALAKAGMAVQGESAAGAFRVSGPRRRQRTSSPVSSGRFY